MDIMPQIMDLDELYFKLKEQATEADDLGPRWEPEEPYRNILNVYFSEAMKLAVQMKAPLSHKTLDEEED